MFSPDGEIITGRDNRLERKETLRIRMRSTSATLLADKQLLRQWCEECMHACLENEPETGGLSGSQQVPQLTILGAKKLSNLSKEGV